jgi:2-polyprenyl-3-methyl-5-hydroxy-6-metoxy-1,4-benzoquinol methylase
MSQQLRQSPVSNIPKRNIQTCPTCGSISQRKLFSAREHEYATTTDDEFTFVKCLDCNTWYLSPRPHESALNIIYPKNYYAYVKGINKKKTNGGFVSSLINKLFKLRIRPLSKYVCLNSQTRWLEIGCGSGCVLESLKETYGFNGVGLDLSEQAVEICRSKGFEAFNCRFEDFSLSSQEKFDVVYSSHVIEHLSSPRDYMQKVHQLLKPGGLCVIITPNTDIWEAKLFGKYWGGLQVPRHWTLLNYRGMKQLGNETNFRWMATHFSTNGFFWGASLHSALVRIAGRKLADFLVPCDQRINDTDIFSFIRIVIFTLLDILNILLFRKSSNMMVIFQKPLGS